MKYIRDLKGIKTIDGRTIKENMLFRSSELFKPNKSQKAYLDSIDLKRIIDLRNKAEIDAEPDIYIEGVETYNFSLVDADLNGVTHEKRSKQLVMLKELQYFEDTYRDFINNEYSSNNVRIAIREIVLNHKYPTLIHCVTGKDRAGIIVYLILRILGVSSEDAIDDYMKQYKMYIGTAYYLYVITYIFSGFDQDLAKKAYDYYAIDPKFINVVLEEINKKYGSFDNYISDYIALSLEDINEFKNIVLE